MTQMQAQLMLTLSLVSRSPTGWTVKSDALVSTTAAPTNTVVQRNNNSTKDKVFVKINNILIAVSTIMKVDHRPLLWYAFYNTSTYNIQIFLWQLRKKTSAKLHKFIHRGGEAWLNIITTIWKIIKLCKKHL